MGEKILPRGERRQVARCRLKFGPFAHPLNEQSPSEVVPNSSGSAKDGLCSLRGWARNQTLICTARLSPLPSRRICSPMQSQHHFRMIDFGDWSIWSTVSIDDCPQRVGCPQLSSSGLLASSQLPVCPSSGIRQLPDRTAPLKKSISQDTSGIGPACSPGRQETS